jgi:osmotically-inducible protein OsmY
MDLLSKVMLGVILLSLPLGVGCETLVGRTRVETPQETILTQSVKEKLLAEKVDLTRVKVATNGTTVSLSGIVASLEARQRAVKLAWEVSGVTTVVNRLQVEK